MQPVRTIVAVLVAATIAITAHTSVDQPSPPPPAPNPTHAPRPPTHPTDPTPPDRQAPIYAAVLRQYLTSGHGHHGGDAGWNGRHVILLVIPPATTRLVRSALAGRPTRPDL